MRAFLKGYLYAAGSVLTASLALAAYDRLRDEWDLLGDTLKGR